MDDDSQNIDVDKVVNHWIESSEGDFKVMQTLFETKSNSWCLFVGHITIEKLLKAYYVRKFRKHAPLTHNLYRLAELNEIELTNEYADWLFEITTFNLNARYDDYKNEFYARCTDEFTTYWVNKIKTLRTWTKEML